VSEKLELYAEMQEIIDYVGESATFDSNHNWLIKQAHGLSIWRKLSELVTHYGESDNSVADYYEFLNGLPLAELYLSVRPKG